MEDTSEGIKDESMNRGSGRGIVGYLRAANLAAIASSAIDRWRRLVVEVLEGEMRSNRGKFAQGSSGDR